MRRTFLVFCVLWVFLSTGSTAESDDNIDKDFPEPLLIEEEDVSDEADDEDAMEDAPVDEGADISDLPLELDWRKTGMVHEAIHQGLTCGSCGTVAGTQALESRIAIVSENYIAHSIQNVMNCLNVICAGGLSTRTFALARNQDYIVSEEESPYVKRECMYKDGIKDPNMCFEQCGHRDPEKYHNALDDQFAIVGGSAYAGTEANLLRALQDGPVTTCYQKSGKQPGEMCAPGCTHMVSIVGYTKDSLILQNSYGKKWGKFDDGSFVTPRNSICGKHVIKKAVYPHVLYDFDRANSKYSGVTEVNESELTFVDKNTYNIGVGDTKNWGTAKNKCAFLGVACRGVVQLSSGAFELVSDFGAGSEGAQKAFKKVQMVVYLRHQTSRSYIGIEDGDNGLQLVTTSEMKEAAPFFTSYGRFISFYHPRFHLVRNGLQPVTGSIREIALNFRFNLNTTNDDWRLTNCNLHNAHAGKSLDVSYRDITMKKKRKEKTVTLAVTAVSDFDASSPSQRFSIGISRRWDLMSELTGTVLSLSKKDLVPSFGPEEYVDKKMSFIWHSRQILAAGSASNVINQEGGFTPVNSNDEKMNEWTPTDCSLTNTGGDGVSQYLGLSESGEVVMVGEDEEKQGWTFEYGDL